MKLDYFRPKARHIFTIGRDLIKDDFSALIELVKNSYDADASEVIIKFEEKNNTLLLSVTDDGEWMSESDIRSRWLVPSTDNKLEKKRTSPKGRVYQGQKWIGRYAASVLWDVLKIETTKESKISKLLINWNDFNDHDKYLDEIPLSISSENTKGKSGTKIIILGDLEKLKIWDIKQLTRLRMELTQLVSKNFDQDEFKIHLDVSKLIDVDKNGYFSDTEVIFSKPDEFFDYKISGHFSSKNKKATLLYQNADTKESIEYELSVDLKNTFFSDDIKRSFPGDFDFDFLVVDKDPVSEREEVSKKMWNIRLISRTDSRKQFDTSYGIKLYRWGFRVRPYWELGDDWLNLDSRRVNNPSFRIGNNQVRGLINIWTEDDSKLKELTSRWGLVENAYFWGLKWIIWKILAELEQKKDLYRKKVWLGRKSKKKLNYKELKKGIIQVISKIDHPKKAQIVKELNKNVDKAFAQIEEREEHLEKILFIYERQATLGKIIGELIHEITQPLSYFKGKLKKLEDLISQLDSLLQYNDNIVEIQNIGLRYRENSLRILKFLKNVEPLANNKRKSEYVPLHVILNSVIDTLRTKLDEHKISVTLNVTNHQVFWDKTDFIVAFSNFMDNSIYWLNLNEDEPVKSITISERIEGKKLYIYFSDNGLGLVKKELKDDIFEPGITLKEKGSGLWLSIAWEVLKRNDVSLSLLESEGGFNLQLIFSQWKQ